MSKKIKPLEPTPFRPNAQPEPEPLVANLPPGHPCPVEALGPLREAVEAVWGMTQAPAAIPAASALALASLAVQGFANVETLGGPRPLSLFVMTIARSGERKSACDGLFTAALREVEKAQARDQRAAMSSHQNAHAIWKSQHERIMRDARQGKCEKRVAAQADLDALGAEPAAPPNTDRIVSEPTFEGLTRLFATGQPSLGLFSDEGGQFLGGFAMNSDNRQKTLAALNSLWQGDPIRRTRAGDGHATLHGRRLALHIMVQPGVARAFMSDPQVDDTGFTARFLISEPASTIGTRFHRNGTRDNAALDAFSARLRAILETAMPMDPETRELQPRLLRLSAGARELLVRFYDTIEAAQAPGGDLAHITGPAGKVAEQAARIAGVMTLWRDLRATEVDRHDMADAITLGQFYLSEASRLASAAAVSAETNRAEKLRCWLLENWPHSDISGAEAVQCGPSALRGDSRVMHAALSFLERHGWLEPLEEGIVLRGKPRKKAWRIVGKG